MLVPSTDEFIEHVAHGDDAASVPEIKRPYPRDMVVVYVNQKPVNQFNHCSFFAQFERILFILGSLPTNFLCPQDFNHAADATLEMTAITAKGQVE